MAADRGQPRGNREAHAGRLPGGGGHQPVGHRARPVRHRDPDCDPRQAAARGGARGRAHRRILLLSSRRGLGLRLPQAEARHADRDREALQRLARGRLYGGRRAARRRGGRGGRRAPGAGAHRQRPGDPRRGQAPARHRGVPGPRGVRAEARAVNAARVPMDAARSVLFALALIAITPPYALIALATFALPRMTRYRVISGWSRSVIFFSKAILRIDWRIEGREHLPATPAIILAKHQSAWETMAFQMIFPPQVHVLKRQLLWIPFFGWGLALMSPIAINRGRGAAALRSIARRGRERLRPGVWAVVFPERTRVAPGELREYQIGGAWLAAESGAPGVPGAHNPGLFLPRNAFLKRPGTVTIRIGPIIEAANRDPKTINNLAETWIEEQQRTLCPGN